MELNLCSEFNIKVNSYNLENSNEHLIKYLDEKNIRDVITDYIPAGYEKDFILNLKKSFARNSTNIIELLDPFYYKAWKYCNKGFFNFKKNFDKFSEEIL